MRITKNKNTMKKSYLLICMLFISLKIYAQQEETSPNGATIQGLKIAFITKQLSLTTDEAEKFWPMYYTYTGELKKAKLEKKEDVLGLEEEVLSIRKKYQSAFKKLLLSDDRSNKVLTAERDFNNVIRKELQQRMQLRNNRKGLPERMEMKNKGKGLN